MSNDDRNRAAERSSLIRTIQRDMRETASYTGRSELQPRVLEALAEVPREVFVPEEGRASAYANVPLPIGYRQTISQPFIVALMTDLLEPEAHHVILEIGTGSGYQAAVLSRLVQSVYSVEVIEPLRTEAEARLASLGYDNVYTRNGDGNLGWPEHAPYDGVIVTAAAASVPEALLEQLKPGGWLVIPVQTGSFQTLQRICKRDADRTVEDVLPVAFVPLVEVTDLSA